MMKILAFILNLLGLGAIILSSFINGNKMKTILLLLFAGNALVATSYLFSENGINGAASCFLACVQIVINYILQRKNKPIPMWLNILYLAGFVGINIWLGGLNFYTLLAVVACSTFILSILQKSSMGYRICSLCNGLLWATYDILTKSYNGLITHATLFAINLVSLMIFDVFGRRKKQP